MAPLIVGAGPAGSAAAIALARAGHAPIIRDQAAATGDALCGGFLSWRTLQALERLGVVGLPGQRVTRVALFAGNRCALAPLPAPALGVSRRALDEALLAVAQAAGARLERGARLVAVEADGTALFDGAEPHRGPLLLATGKHDVRGLPRQAARAAFRDPSVGIRVRLGPDPALARMVGDKIELHLFDRGYAGLVLQEGGVANLCLAVRKSALRDCGGGPEALLDRLADRGGPLARRLAWWDRSAPIDAVGAIPYGWRARSTRPGHYLLGDQAACIPSLAGEGIGLALASGLMAAAAWAEHGAEGAQAYQLAFARAAHRPLVVAGAVWALLERPLGAAAAVGAVALAPSVAAWVARLTRVEPVGPDPLPNAAAGRP